MGQLRKHGAYMLAVFALFTTSAFAGTGSGRAAIEHVGVFNNMELVFFYTTAHDGAPSCNTNRKRWVLDISTTLGKSQYAFLMAAVTADSEIRVSGTGGCIYPDSETISWIGQPINYTGDSTQIPSF